MKKLILTLILILLTQTSAYAHSASNKFWGEVPVDMLLSGDVLIVKPLIVPAGVTLTIEPGTTVRFEKSSDGSNRIVVQGLLVAVGTKDMPIKFIPKDKDAGRWKGIIFENGGGGRLENCTVEGSSDAISHTRKKAVTIKDVSIR